MTEIFLSQLENEAPRTRGAIENVPEGREDWRPHEKSMTLGGLASLVAGMPGWIAMMIQGDELDLNPPGGGHSRPPSPRNLSERMKALDEGVAKAEAALKGTTDEHLMKPWRLLVAGKIVNENPRHVVLRETLMHLAQPSRSVDGIPATQQRAGAGHLRPVGRRRALRVKLTQGEDRVAAAYDPFIRGRHPVCVRTIQARDAARDRRFECEIWYPAAARLESRPLILSKSCQGRPHALRGPFDTP